MTLRLHTRKDPIGFSRSIQVSKPVPRVSLKAGRRGKAKSSIKLSQILTQLAVFDRSSDSRYNGSTWVAPGKRD
jgi:hypothetical protein